MTLFKLFSPEACALIDFLIARCADLADCTPVLHGGSPGFLIAPEFLCISQEPPAPLRCVASPGIGAILATIWPQLALQGDNNLPGASIVAVLIQVDACKCSSC